MADYKHYNQRPNGKQATSPSERKHTQNNQQQKNRHSGKGDPYSDNKGKHNPYESYTCKGNLGLLFTRRYYSEINMEVLKETSIKIRKVIKKANGRTVIKTDNTNHQSLYYESRNNNIINQAKQFSKPDFEQMPKGNVPHLELTTIYPGLLTGVGIPHAANHKGEAKLGLAFDYTTGLPYIPGSSVKGLLRSLFPLQDLALADKYEKKDSSNKSLESTKLREKARVLKEKASKKSLFIASMFPSKKISNKMIEELERSIFNGLEYNEEKNSIENSSIRDIFFDAFPVSSTNGLLGLDYITPHTNGEFIDPTPIQFMLIAPNVTLRFEFRLHDTTLSDGTIITASDKRDLFETILTTVGIGAKTNVGYGQLKQLNNAAANQ